MKSSVERKIETEIAKDGLVILEAWYGNLSDNDGSDMIVRNGGDGGSNSVVSGDDDGDSSWQPSSSSSSSSPSSSPFSARKDVFDVRISVQALVHESQLSIPGGYSKVD